ncbi:MAG: UDP-N-acetylmuramoyl-L-alanyl-D-glutamate--2,6-diaminopimelate ligase [Treponemataceae bacterium]|nr:UDP-N-acetylmuramoyl-L-alanyl-D-glutamate--2,6-diaminopimelate ligase [Treponemataceae bacterium]
MQKSLYQILENADIECPAEHKNIQIKGLAFDSRAVKEGFLFFALPGVHTNGNRFIAAALKNGAKAIVYQDELPEDLQIQSDIAFLHVKDSRFVMAPISEAFYDFPTKKLVIFGVTGTEGKSSTVSFLWQLLRKAGRKCGFISTVEYSLGEEALPNPEHQTTPEAPIICAKLYDMIQNGCTHAVIESSSHGLSEKTNRLGSVLFDAVAFMNVTQEHLEFHGTLEQYRADKANLFKALNKHDHKKILGSSEKAEQINAAGAVNLDDKAAGFFAQKTTHKVFGFSLKENPSVPDTINDYFTAKDIAETSTGVTCRISKLHKQGAETKIEYEQSVSLSVRGSFNVYNALASTILISAVEGIDERTIFEWWKTLKPITGRMSIIDEGQPFEVVVDYAHTPSSFSTIFEPLDRRLHAQNHRIISVFGSAGERDTQKRPEQGRIASEHSDIVILTDEDPRKEDGTAILKEIAAGCTNKTENENMFLINNRPKAIRKAFSLAKQGDLVLLLGKGHENSIIYNDTATPYDEIAEAKAALKEMGYTKAQEE